MSTPDIASSIREQRRAELEAQIRRVVDAAPALSDDQRARIAAIVRNPSMAGGGDAA